MSRDEKFTRQVTLTQSQWDLLSWSIGIAVGTLLRQMQETKDEVAKTAFRLTVQQVTEVMEHL